MNWTLFFSTFLLIFFAELGDKTQLAVMSQSAATSSSKWTIFIAAVLALTFATAIGILMGNLLKKIIPDDRWIKIISGTLFLVIGSYIILSVFSPRRQRIIHIVQHQKEAPSTWNGLFVMHELQKMEEKSMLMYKKQAERSLFPVEKACLLQLYKEEQWHNEAMLYALNGKAKKDFMFTPEMVRDLPSPQEFIVKEGLDDDDFIQEAIRLEKAAARFYRVLSETVSDQRLRDTFRALQVTEENHAKRLQNLLLPTE